MDQDLFINTLRDTAILSQNDIGKSTKQQKRGKRVVYLVTNKSNGFGLDAVSGPPDGAFFKDFPNSDEGKFFATQNSQGISGPLNRSAAALTWLLNQQNAQLLSTVHTTDGIIWTVVVTE